MRPFHDLQSYLTFLEANRMLRRVRVEVDPEYEITEIVTSSRKRGRPSSSSV